MNVRLGAMGEKGSFTNDSYDVPSMGNRNVRFVTATVSRKQAGGAAGGATGAGAYITYKRRTKSGKTITVRRRRTK